MPGHTEREEAGVRRALAAAALAELDRLVESATVGRGAAEQVRRGLSTRYERAAAEAGDDPGGGAPDDDVRALRRALTAAETAELHRLYENGEVAGATMRRLQHALDLERASLGET
ncbi:hypothetical protein [Streptomyces sp. 8L]|uniref:hypothetical protein n=1 Tax=Streptomyces sp. 8L TaxID=2877242 RepID=UPI0027E19E4A|nr:hypothetical protein [Streptomyces sp. 8L]